VKTVDPPTDADVRKRLIAAANRLSREVDRLTFDPPVTHVYNPLDYARRAHHQYLGLCQPASTKVLFLGMNPGPWGMAQTGVPFGHVETVRQWLAIDARINKPPGEHPKRPIQGLDCTRSEVSGERLWGLFRRRYGTPEAFFRDHFVINYCPLVFMESTARNRTPDKLPATERTPLDAACDAHLATVIRLLAPTHVVGVGAYAENCLRRVLAGQTDAPAISRILHPSPASPAANRDWPGRATAELIAAGIWQAG